MSRHPWADASLSGITGTTRSQKNCDVWTPWHQKSCHKARANRSTTAFVGGQLCSPRAGPVSCRRVNYTHAHICRWTWRKTAGQGRRAWWDLGLGPRHRVHPSRAPMERRNGRIMTVAGWGCRLSKVRGLSGNGSRSLTLERKGRPLSHLISPGQALKFWQVPASSCYAVHAAPLHK